MTGQVGGADDAGFIAAELRDPQVRRRTVVASGQTGQVCEPGGLPDQITGSRHTPRDDEHAGIEDGGEIGHAPTQPGADDTKGEGRNLANRVFLGCCRGAGMNG